LVWLELGFGLGLGYMVLNISGAFLAGLGQHGYTLVQFSI
jgi:hypothetical protein